MGIKRIVDTSFWTDGKVDEFTPEDKYFMLYLLTNPHTTQLGIYEIGIKRAAYEMGYSQEAVRALIERFECSHGIIFFSKETSEIAVKNFLYHSIIKGGAPVRDCLVKEMKNVKNKSLIANVFSHLQKRPNYEETVNETVRNIISEYWEKSGELRYCNEKDNDTPTIRERYVDDTYDNDNENDNENENDNDNEKDNKNAKGKCKQPTKAEIDSFFDSIWSLYPEKKGKGQVSDSKRKTLFKIGFEEMQRAVDRYKQELKKDASWRKPQNGSTFFNSGYVDYLDANFEPTERTDGNGKYSGNGNTSENNDAKRVGHYI